jgi:hypothetical protein
MVQLGLLSPESVQVELHGQRITYTLDTIHGRTEHGVEEVCHIKGMSIDGLRGLSAVAVPCAARLVLKPPSVSASVYGQRVAPQRHPDGARPGRQ